MKVLPDIKAKMILGGLTQVSLSEHFHCTQPTMQRILSNRSVREVRTHKGLVITRQEVMEYIEGRMR